MEEGSELAVVMMVIIAKVVVEVDKEAAMKVNEEMIKPKSVN